MKKIILIIYKVITKTFNNDRIKLYFAFFLFEIYLNLEL